MSDDNKLKSTLIYGSNRTYFFDVKISQEGGKYLVIQENRLNTEQHQITVGEENLAQFLKALHHLLPEFGIEEPSIGDFINAFKPWTPEEDEDLERYSVEGTPLPELSQIFQRRKKAIQVRIEKLKRKEHFK